MSERKEVTVPARVIKSGVERFKWVDTPKEPDEVESKQRKDEQDIEVRKLLEALDRADRMVAYFETFKFARKSVDDMKTALKDRGIGSLVNTILGSDQHNWRPKVDFYLAVVELLREKTRGFS